MGDDEGGELRGVEDDEIGSIVDFSEDPNFPGSPGGTLLREGEGDQADGAFLVWVGGFIVTTRIA